MPGFDGFLGSSSINRDGCGDRRPRVTAADSFCQHRGSEKWAVPSA